MLSIVRIVYRIILFVVLSATVLPSFAYGVENKSGEAKSVPLQIATPVAPQISVAPEIYYPLDETLYLEGRAEPRSQVELFFEKPGSNQVRIMVDSNSNGEWFLSQRLELGSGEWMVRARASGDPPSDWSNPRLIQSRITGFVVGSTRIKYAPVAAVLVLLFILGGGLLVYSIVRVRKLRREMHESELKEGMEKLKDELRAKDRESAEILLEQNFSEIRKGLLEELEHLETKATRGGALSHDEEAHRAKLLRELREAEEGIQKKLKSMR